MKRFSSGALPTNEPKATSCVVGSREAHSMEKSLNKPSPARDVERFVREGIPVFEMPEGDEAEREASENGIVIAASYIPAYQAFAHQIARDYMELSATQQARPWDRPFWKPIRGKEGVFTYLVLIHLLSVIGLILFPLPNLKVIGMTLLFVAFGGLGTTVCYHRLLAHKTLKVNRFVEQFLIFWAVFNGTGHPASWVAYHRRHHAVTDLPEDISSPKQGGFWWAHLRWLYQTEPADKKHWAPELTGGIYRIWGWAETPVILLSIFIGLILGLGWMGFFWMGALRLVYSLHLQCLVNSLTHLGEANEGDSSMNVWWLGPFQLTAWGENWHKNHHTHAGSARLGLRWYQTDIGWYFIWMLEAIGLAHSVKRPRAS
jgi:fatty-acid desaturase